MGRVDEIKAAIVQCYYCTNTYVEDCHRSCLDCASELGQDLDALIAEARVEAIDEFLRKLSKDISFRSLSDRIGCMEIFRGIAEELKEKKNETDGRMEHN